MEEFRPKVSFQLEELTTDGGLLNAIRHFARSSRNPPMPGDMVEELEVMNVDSKNIILVDDHVNDYRLPELAPEEDCEA